MVTTVHVLDWNPGMRFEGCATFCGIDGKPFGWPHDAWWVHQKDYPKANCWRCFKAMKDRSAIGKPLVQHQ
jgi:hypothetical protein